MSEQEATNKTATSSEPTIEEWHDLLDVVLTNLSPEVERTIGFLLRTTPSGKAYLDRVKDVRPEIEIGEGLNLWGVTATCDASLVVDRLVASARYGKERDLSIHEFALTEGWVSEPQEAYPLVIAILRVKEKRAKEKSERDRFKGSTRGGSALRRQHAIFPRGKLSGTGTSGDWRSTISSLRFRLL